MGQRSKPAGALSPQGSGRSRSGGNSPAGRLLGVLLVGVFMGALDIAIVGPALPSIGRQFGVDERQLAWVFTIYVLCNLVGNPLMAKLSDLYGRRPIYMADVGAFALGSVVVAAAPSFPVLLAGRAVQGFAAGGIFPVASATVGETFPPERRGRALGMIGAMFGLAFLLGPILGGILLSFGWPWLFLINVPLAAVVLALSQKVLPAPRRAGAARFDWPGMILLGVGLTSLALGLNSLDTRDLLGSLLSSRVGPLFVVAAAALVAFAGVERRAVEPLVHPRLMANRQLLLANLLGVLSGLIQAGLVFIPSLAVAAFGVKPSTAAYLLGPAVLASTLGAPISGRLLDRAGSRPVIAAGTALLTLGLVLVPVVSQNVALFVADGVLVGFGLASLTGAPLRYVVLNEAESTTRAAAQSLLTVASNIGQMAGSAGVGAIVASHGGGVAGYQVAFLTLGVMAAGGFSLSWALKGRQGDLAGERTAAGKRSSGP